MGHFVCLMLTSSVCKIQDITQYYFHCVCLMLTSSVCKIQDIKQYYFHCVCLMLTSSVCKIQDIIQYYFHCVCLMLTYKLFFQVFEIMSCVTIRGTACGERKGSTPHPLCGST